MRITLGEYHAVDRSIPVTFTDGDFTHDRRMNAVVDASGKFDREATEARAVDVGRGVAAKRAAGVFTPLAAT